MLAKAVSSPITLRTSNTARPAFTLLKPNDHPAYQRAEEQGIGLKWFNFYAKFFSPLMFVGSMVSFLYLLVYRSYIKGDTFLQVLGPMAWTLVSFLAYGILTILLRDFQAYWANVAVLTFYIVTQLYPATIIGTMLLYSKQTLNLLNAFFRMDISGHILFAQIAVWTFVALNAIFCIGNLLYFYKRDHLFNLDDDE